MTTLVHAAKLIIDGVNPVVACRSCIAEAFTDDGYSGVRVKTLAELDDGLQFLL